jgi:hypothetical protein
MKNRLPHSESAKDEEFLGFRIPDIGRLFMMLSAYNLVSAPETSTAAERDSRVGPTLFHRWLLVAPRAEWHRHIVGGGHELSFPVEERAGWSRMQKQQAVHAQWS